MAMGLLSPPLHIPLDLEVDFSIRQGDLASFVMFTIPIEPFLIALENIFKWLSMADLTEVADRDVDDINQLGRMK
jgi:hypothetical protein